MIQAFKQLIPDNPEVRLIIYGGGPYESTLQELITSLSLQHYIQLAGNTPGAWNLLYDAHCFVFPSWYEGFSGALVEAMMMGIPIVASDIPMNREAVEHEATALVFPVKNIDALAGAMKRVVNHYEEARQMGLKAREVAVQRFDLKQIAKEYEAFLKSPATH